VIGVHSFGSKADPHVVTEPLCVEHLQVTVGAEQARTSVNDAGVEDGDVAGLHVPAENLVVGPVALDVREGNEAVIADLVVTDLIALVASQCGEVDLGVAVAPHM